MFPALLLVGLLPPTVDGYRKIEMQIPMRDGVNLYTAVYVPTKIAGKHPILLERTPYSAGPYGSAGRDGFDGSSKFKENGYIFAFQDVRGQYMSSGTFVNVRPTLKPGEKGIDESTDAWDTIDYLVKHVPDNNGSVGLWGISYPGFYAAAAGINSHPALKAISPQAPVSDWFIGDDVHHNGAFFLQDNFGFDTWFDNPRKGLEKDHKSLEVPRGKEGDYSFFLKAGTLDDLNKNVLKGRLPYWTEIHNHSNYDEYWKARALPPHLKKVRCAVLTVGGWFDAEDQWGALNTYAAVEKQNPGTPNTLVMGPWYHGMWADGKGEAFGDLNFGTGTSEWFRENVEFPFFDRYLRGEKVAAPAEATVFETGVNRWRTFGQWPPAGMDKTSVYLGSSKTLLNAAPTEAGLDSYVYDPAQPTPYIENLKSDGRPAEYMVEDQRWADNRTDVVGYKGAVLDKNLTVAGPIDVDLWASTTGTDADFIVKVIDVWPDDSKAVSPRGKPMAGFEQLLRGDVMRGKFRDSLSDPKAFVPGAPTRVHFHLNDVLHTFLPGHRIMIQVQSAWFPLVDRNPNKFVDIYHAKISDFQPATISIYHDPQPPSSLTFGTLGG